jgi:hypothetical protein
MHGTSICVGRLYIKCLGISCRLYFHNYLEIRVGCDQESEKEPAPWEKRSVVCVTLVVFGITYVSRYKDDIRVALVCARSLLSQTTKVKL